MAWATLSIPPFSRQFARLGHQFDELSKRDRFLRPGTTFLISIPLTLRDLPWVISGHLQCTSPCPLWVTCASQNGMSALPPKAILENEAI
jgi:hypothetical protein